MWKSLLANRQPVLIFPELAGHLQQQLQVG